MKTPLALLVLLLCSSAHADSLLMDVLGSFTAHGIFGTSICDGCTQSVHARFQYDPSLVTTVSGLPGTDVFPGSLIFETSGFLGSAFSGSGHIASDLPPFMAFTNGLGDEIDINFDGSGLFSSVTLFSCQSDGCSGAYGGSWVGLNLAAQATASARPVPEPAAVALIGFGAAFAVCRRRRNQEASSGS